MKKIIKLTESDLTRIVKRVIEEEKKITFTDYIDEVYDELKRRFDLTGKEIDKVIDYHSNDIEDAFQQRGGYVSPKKLVSSFVKDGKLK
jgi:predicted transcriptional regulator